MSSKTSNYNLHKIDLTDAPPDITVLNPNFDTIDSTMKTLSDGVSTAQSTATTANNTAIAAMPKSGGTFTGAVGYNTANSSVVKSSSYSFRNIAVFNNSGTAVSSGNIRMIRK